ncbi:MAG: D-alanyl-D-alanine carboxypeptidase/D-alanyl-D-alanine-endopeptidase [Gemmatimonadaceae bacterium]|nr:D-alanyl-D-alanine carboxypeptidase/D-alanyl-D-alanine-endopeptidase [Gemmatimonadaceae bacterium]
MHRSVSWPTAPRAMAVAALAILLLAPSGDPSELAVAAVRRELSVGHVGVVEAQSRTRRSRTRRTTRVVRAARPAAAPVIGWTSPRGTSELSADFSSMINTRVRSGKFGVMVVSLTRGDTLFAHEAGDMMQPASTMKLYSTAVALDRFGPEHVFSTDVLRDASRDSAAAAGGVVNGNIYLRADGDPSMSSRFWKDPNYPMTTLARAVAAAGIKRVTGDLIYDATAFDDQKIPDGWKTKYLGAAYAARVSALSLNENVVWVAVRPEGGSAHVELEPASTAIPLTNNVRLVRGSGGRIIARQTNDGIVVSGTIGSNSGPLRYSLVVPDPAMFTAGALQAALKSAGVTVDGTVKPGKTPAGATKVAAFASPPLSQIISEMNRESINVVAELLFRDAARASAPGGQSSADAGLANLREFLSKKVGVDPATINVSDGSGLSTLDSLTPRNMVHLLSYAHRGPWSSAFHGSLPVAGESELLRRRMRSTPAQGNLHAKTGTTDTVIGLGGYVTAKDGEIMAFSFIYNGTDRWNAKATMDAMGATLANFVRE